LAIAVERIERQIRERHSDIQNIFIEAKSIAASLPSEVVTNK
jgi:uncharacterized protein (UPF0335 family)